MTSRRRRILVCLLALAVVGFVGERIIAGDLDRPDDWVEAHASALPSTYDELAAYPRGYRRAIMRVLSPEAKSELWREQLRRFVRSGNLNQAQRHFVDKAYTLLAPSTFVDKEPVRVELEALCRQSKTLFNKNEAQWFGDIGVPGKFTVSARAFRGTMLSWLEAVRQVQPIRSLRHSYVAYAAPGIICDCHQGSWCLEGDCGPDADECSGDISCFPASGHEEDCGCFRLWACNGVCVKEIEGKR